MEVPPLWVRPGDVPALQKRFLKRAAQTGHPLEMTPTAVRRLEGHSFYGNITEALELRVQAGLSKGSEIRDLHGFAWY